MKLNTLCTQAFNPCCAFLHIVPIAWTWLFTPLAPPLPIPPYGPLGKLLLPFESLICNFYQLQWPTIPVCMRLRDLRRFTISVLKPGEFQVSWDELIILPHFSLTELLSLTSNFPTIFFLMLPWEAHCIALIHIFSQALVHAHSCPTLRNPVNYGLSDSSVHGVFQARMLE